MAFNLKKVLKALLLSSNQALAIKDIQAAFARFHEQSQVPLVTEDQVSAEVPAAADGTVAEPAPTGEAAAHPTDEVPAAAAESLETTGAEVVEEVFDGAQDPELYSGVPELVTVTQIRETMDQIAVELRASDEGLLLIEGANGYRLVTHPRFARWVRILRQEPPPVRLNQSSVETLAVVAYRQPVTRTEIETIRGVSAEAGINKLLEKELIYIVGRADLPGRPLQYGTTDKFLEFVGIKSCDELPASDVLSSRQIDEWLRNSSTAHKPNDTDMGLANEELPLEGAAPASQPPTSAAP